MSPSTAAGSLRSPTADEQGDRSDTERARAATASLAHSFSARTAMNLDACIHCGMCADACHFFVATEDARYVPILKAEPLKQAYKRESAPFAPLFRWLGLKKPVTEEELAEWQHLVYDSCNLCGRCSLVCPMGIDVASLIEETRHAMFDAGLAPQELYDLAANQFRTGSPNPDATPYQDQLEAIGREHGVAIPIDRDDADIMVTVSSFEVENYPGQIAALARVMEHLSPAYTFRSEGLLADNMAYYAGSRDWQRILSERLVDVGRVAGVSTVIVPECGHCYTALRWEAAELMEEPLPFRVLHISEYLAEQLEQGNLQLKKADTGSVTFHDPCQLVRKGGVTKAPRALMKAMGIEVLEPGPHIGFGYCCGGGGGVNMIRRADELRHQAVEVKIHELEATGADTLMTACSGCRYSFDDALQHSRGHYEAGSLVELVAAHLEGSEEKNR